MTQKVPVGAGGVVSLCRRTLALSRDIFVIRDSIWESVLVCLSSRPGMLLSRLQDGTMNAHTCLLSSSVPDL